MVLHIAEKEVQQLFSPPGFRHAVAGLTMAAVIAALEDAFRHLAQGRAENQSRHRLITPSKTVLHYMAAADYLTGYFGMKIYSSGPKGIRFFVPLYQIETGEMVAFIEADILGQMRTGAASGLATRYMAREDASEVGLIGTGLQARTQLLGVAAVRRIKRIGVFGRDEKRRLDFARRMTEELGIPVEPQTTAEAAVREADIVITATTACDPVLLGRWLKPGTHVNAVGANFPTRRELDLDAIERASSIVVDSVEQSKIEAGDLIIPFAAQPERWNSVRELSDLASGTLRVPTDRNRREITLFKSNGVALEDVALGRLVYERARERKVGREVPLWEGLETTSNF